MSEEELQKQLAAMAEENKKLQDILQANKNEDTTLESLQASVVKIQEENKNLSQININMKLDQARAKAIVEFPLASGFPLMGTTEEQIREQAKQNHENVKIKTDAAAKAAADQAQQQWGQMGQGSPPGLISTKDLESEEAKAKEKLKTADSKSLFDTIANSLSISHAKLNRGMNERSSGAR